MTRRHHSQTAIFTPPFVFFFIHTALSLCLAQSSGQNNLFNVGLSLPDPFSMDLDGMPHESTCNRTSRVTSRVILDTGHNAMYEGCLRGWRFCYYPNQNASLNKMTVTFALWRNQSNSEEKYEMVNKSNFIVPVTTLNSEQQVLSCEWWDVSGCQVNVMQGDVAGVIISRPCNDPPLSLVGRMDRERVRVGDLNEDNSVTDLEEEMDRGLLVAAIVDMDTCNGNGTETSCPSEVDDPEEDTPG